MKKELIKVQVEWSPRSGNIVADALANGVHEFFDPRLRLDIDLSFFRWEILPEALKMGELADLEAQNALSRGERPNRAVKQRKRKPHERMRVTDLW